MLISFFKQHLHKSNNKASSLMSSLRNNAISLFKSHLKCDITFKITNRSKVNKSHLKFNGNFKSNIIFEVTLRNFITLLISEIMKPSIREKLMILTSLCSKLATVNNTSH
jgi:hypothetical protein